VGYEKGDFYRIYHPVSKEVKVSRDVIFDENQFFNMREVKGSTSAIEMERGTHGDGGISDDIGNLVDVYECGWCVRCGREGRGLGGD
jgi:hypothetical protein